MGTVIHSTVSGFFYTQLVSLRFGIFCTGFAGDVGDIRAELFRGIALTTLHCREILPYTAKQLYDLVNDIEAYPDFLPWCGHAKVFTRDEHYLLAAIEVTAKGIRKSFTTRNTLVPYQKITMELVKGPFKRFTSVWHFIAVDQESCEVTFDISFAFSNRLLSVLLGKTFNYAAGKMIDAFAQRAASLYGKKN